jgi:hypothetical protein
MSKWQPIETAPQNTLILVWMPYWFDDEDGRIAVASGPYWTDGEGNELQGYPTHWQPLPDRPLSPPE